MRGVKALTSWEKPNLTQQEPEIWETVQRMHCPTYSHSGFKNYSWVPFDISMIAEWLIITGQPEENVSKMFSQMWGTLFARRGGTGGVSGSLKKRWRESHSGSSPWAIPPAHAEQCGWGGQLLALPRNGDATQTLPPAAEASHLCVSFVTLGSVGLKCKGGEFPAGTCSSWPGGQLMAKHSTWMGSCSHVGDWHQDLSLWVKTRGYSRGSKQLLHSLPFLLSHSEDRAAARAQGWGAVSGLRFEAHEKMPCSAGSVSVGGPGTAASPARSMLKRHHSVGKKSAVPPQWNEDEGQDSAEHLHPHFCLSSSWLFITYFSHH